MSIWALIEDQVCYYCGSTTWSHPGICPSCASAFKRQMDKKGMLCSLCSQPVLSSKSDLCPFCLNLPESVGRFISLSYFNGIMKEAVTLYKTGKMPAFRFFLAELINDVLIREGLEDAVIVPVPPRKWKIHQTGWDQVDLLCRTLRSRYRREVCRCLIRSDRLQQKTLSYKERKVHMENNLRVKDQILEKTVTKRLVLLDDVSTSGATIGAAADLLSGKGRGPVSALVLSTVI